LAHHGPGTSSTSTATGNKSPPGKAAGGAQGPTGAAWTHQDGLPPRPDQPTAPPIPGISSGHRRNPFQAFDSAGPEEQIAAV